MRSKDTEYKTIDEYILACPQEVRGTLNELRRTIKSAAPKAEERISYRMPAFWFKGYLVYFAAFKHHIGFFPTGTGISAFAKALAGYATSKGTVRFPLDRPLPYALIGKIVKFKVAENVKKEKKRLDRKE